MSGCVVWRLWLGSIASEVDAHVRVRAGAGGGAGGGSSSDATAEPEAGAGAEAKQAQYPQSDSALKGSTRATATRDPPVPPGGIRAAAAATTAAAAAAAAATTTIATAAALPNVAEGLQTSLWVVCGIASVFWGLLLFDIVADGTSNKTGLAAWLATTCALSLAMAVVLHIQQARARRARLRYVGRSVCSAGRGAAGAAGGDAAARHGEGAEKVAGVQMSLQIHPQTQVVASG